MSAGAFTRSKYEADDGTIYPIRVQPETIIAAANPAPAGAVAAGVPSARANGGRRVLGVNARAVYVTFTATPPAGYKPDSILKIPILTKTAYDAKSRGSTFAYLGGTVTVTGKKPEYIN